MDQGNDQKTPSVLQKKKRRFKKPVDLGKDPILPLILRFALPAIYSYFISELYNMVDTYYVGNEVGANAIGALGTVFPIQRIIIALSLLLAFGTSNRIAFFLGQKNQLEAEKTASAGLILNVLIMLPYTLLIYFFRLDIIPFLGAKDALLAPASEYVSIIIWGGVFLTLGTTMVRIILTLGHAGLSVVLTSLGAFINIIVDEILVRQRGMGIEGAAYATLLSQVLSFLITLVFYIAITKKMHFKFRPNFSGHRFAKVFTTGLPSFIVESEDAFVMAILNLLLFHLGGEMGVNVMAMNTKVYMFLFVLILGFSYGMETVIAYNHGAKKPERVEKSVKVTLFLSLGAGILTTVLFYIYAEPLLGFFVEDHHLIERCVPTFRRMIIGLPLLAFYYTGVMFFQAMGKALASTILTLLRQIAILLPLSLIFVYVLNVNLDNLFFAYPLTDIIAALISIILLRKYVAQEKKALKS